MSTHKQSESAPVEEKRRSRHAVRILVQAGFILLACLGCTAVLVAMIGGQLSQKYIRTLREEILQYSEMTAQIVPYQAVDMADEEAIAYLEAYLESVLSVADGNPGADYGYALYRLEGELVQCLVLGPGVSGPAGSAEQYLTAAASGVPTLLDDGYRLSALHPVWDEEGEPVGIMEITCDWSVFQRFTADLRTNILLACGIGVAGMLAVYFLTAIFAALRERRTLESGGEA